MGGCAWVTLATNDSYSLGALVLAHSLRQVNTVHQLAALVTPGVTPVMREKLASVFNVVVEVNILDSKDEANLRLLKRPELGVTFTKLHCWKLTQFEKCVFLDADTMVLANADELFDKEEFSAAPDVGWPDCFNSGVFVFRPSEDTYNNLVKFALDKGSFDGGDQGLLNLYFSDWAHKDISKHLPFIYNTCSTACYSYLPAFKQFGSNVKIIHFIGNAKPWLQYFDSETRQVHVGSDLQHLHVVLQQWWNIFCASIHPMLSPQMAGLAGAFARLTLGAPRSAEQAMLEDQLRRQGWEVGNIDFMGRDSFDNIWTKICETLNTSSTTAQSDQSTEPNREVEDVKATIQTGASVEASGIISKSEETKSHTEGITQLSEDTQKPITVSPTLAHAETQSQQHLIPLQDKPKEGAVATEAPSVSTIVQPTEKEILKEISSSDTSNLSQSKPSNEVAVAEPIKCIKPETSETPKQSLTHRSESANLSSAMDIQTDSTIAPPDTPVPQTEPVKAPTVTSPSQTSTSEPINLPDSPLCSSKPVPCPKQVTSPLPPAVKEATPTTPIEKSVSTPTIEPSKPIVASIPPTAPAEQAINLSKSESPKPTTPVEQVILTPSQTEPQKPTTQSSEAHIVPKEPAVSPKTEPTKPTVPVEQDVSPSKAEILIPSSPIEQAGSPPKSRQSEPVVLPTVPKDPAASPKAEPKKPTVPVTPSKAEHPKPTIPMEQASSTPQTELSKPISKDEPQKPASQPKPAAPAPVSEPPAPVSLQAAVVDAPTKSDDKGKASGKTSAKHASAKAVDPKPTAPAGDSCPTPPPRKSAGGGGSASKKPAKGGKK